MCECCEKKDLLLRDKNILESDPYYIQEKDGDIYKVDRIHKGSPVITLFEIESNKDVNFKKK